MNVLVAGAGQGSWTMRGLQLGAALGARVTSEPGPADWAWADVAVLVKKHGARFAPAAREAGVPVVWDAVDCWRQPSENGLDDRAALRLLETQVGLVRPRLVVGATRAQARDFATIADGWTAAYLPHHSWSGVTPAPARERVAVVGYQGNAAYLGAWRGVLERLCAARGWRLSVAEDGDLREVDVVVALRDGPWDGWMCRQWKSGVKVVNALAAGRPLLTQSTAAFSEIGSPGDVVETAGQLERALDEWAPYERRAAAAAACTLLAPAYTLDAVAQLYRSILTQAFQGAPCTAS